MYGNRLCDGSRCSREATKGTRCAIHWIRRTKQGRELRKSRLWSNRYERQFADGLDIRRATLRLLFPGEMLAVGVTQYPPTYHDKWTRLTGELIAAFDKEKK